MREKEAKNEYGKLGLAELAATSDWNEAQMPSLQLGQIQGGRTALLRWADEVVCTSTRTMHLLLAALLLAYVAGRGSGIAFTCLLRLAGFIPRAGSYRMAITAQQSAPLLAFHASSSAMPHWLTHRRLEDVKQWSVRI